MKTFWRRSAAYLLLVALLVSAGIWTILRFDLAERILISLDYAGASAMPSSDQGLDGSSAAVPNPMLDRVPEGSPQTPTVRPTVEEGRLVALLNGQMISDESFQLTQTTDGLQLSAQGQFYPQVLVFHPTVSFEQEMQWGRDFRPQRYSLEAHGLLGFGDRSIQIEVGLQQATIKNGGSETQRPLESGPFFLAGSFSSYAILPKLLSAHDQPIHLRLPVIPSGWRGDEPSGDSAAERADFAPFLTMDRRGAATVVGNDPGDKQLQVERYTLMMGKLISDVFMQGDEFIGSSSVPVRPDTIPELIIYRADIFPHGFHLVPLAP